MFTNWLDRNASYVSVNGARCWVRQFGNRQQGKPSLIFIHPPLLTSANFLKQFRGLSAHYHCIGLDLRGHGRSRASYDPLDYPQIVADLHDLHEKLELKQCYLVGYSTGGGVALHALAAHPDRFRGAVVVSGMAEVDDWKLLSRFLIAIGLSRPSRIHVLQAVVTSGNSDSLSILWRLWNESRQGDAEQIRQYYTAGLTTSFVEPLTRIEQPVLMIYGEDDRDFHKYALQLQARLPNQTLRTIIGQKHRLPTFAGEEVNRLVHQWLQNSLSF
jgi:pimeloyl-ACP methyl ester carboxylesterase